MIIGEIHPGSGLGNQLFRYITTRVLALDKGYEFGFRGSKNFKGVSFMSLDFGKPLNVQFEVQYYETGKMRPSTGEYSRYEEKCIRDEFKNDIRSYDPEINFVNDNTIIDGEFQDSRYWEHRLSEIREWLKVEPLEMPDDLCVINFRGGEFAAFPDLFLTQDYWDRAIEIMRNKYPNIRFEVHTDDPETAKQFFPDFKIWDNKMITTDKQYANIGFNWRSIRYAKHLIIANTSFAILPALLNEDVKEVIAPRYWARRNTKVWALPQNYYKQFTYI